MAIYHCSVKNISRAKGQSAVAAASYRSGECLVENMTGRILACRHNLGGVEYTQLIGYEGRRNDLWNAAEAAEKRKDARTAKEVEVALPAELDQLQRIAVAVDFAEELRKRYGVALDVALHTPSKIGSMNYHAHIMMTTRETDGNKLGKKVRKLDSEQELKEIRKLWQDTANKHLAQAEQKQRIDCRSLKERGIDRIPTIHEGHNGHPDKYNNLAMNAEIKEINKALAIIENIKKQSQQQLQKLLTYTAKTIKAVQFLREEAYDGIRQAIRLLTFSFKAREAYYRKRRNRKIAEYITQQNTEEYNVYRAV